MSDDNETPEDDAPMGQDAVDDIFGGDDDTAGGGMALDEIEGAEISKQTVDSSYDIGEPMAEDVTAIYDIPVQISAVLGRSTMQVSQLLKLGRGAVVELDRKVGEAIDIYVNNRLVARGEVVVVEDKLGVTMTEIVKSDRS
jgi:flagellar motor switch protein FliN/FliY